MKDINDISKKKLERKAFRLIHDAGGEGILQSEMRKILGVRSREGSRIAIKLLKRGSIERLKELHESRWTYRLFFTKKPATIDSIMNCPCMACDDIYKCTPGRFISPINCPRLTDWINEGTEKDKIKKIRISVH
ncbi:MAG: transcriptional regulator [Candidatus Bathyarchaeota archaeon]|nr:transcriptional regulator [Candidatus Bathyarchaeota archaeon]